MKTQLSKPARSKARYTEEYKTGGAGVMAQQWPQRSQGSGRAGYSPTAALSLGARRNACQRQSPGNESKSGRSVEELEAENRRLRAENAKLLEQREVLKKSLGILSEVPPRGMPESNR